MNGQTGVDADSREIAARVSLNRPGFAGGYLV
jgi:hypothetical protein